MKNWLIAYKKIVANAKKTFKFHKKEHFKSFASSINFRNNISYVWKTCKILKNKWIQINPKHSPENLQSHEKIKTALNKICPPWANTDPIWVPKCQTNEFFDFPFDFVEFNTSLNRTKNKSSPGKDGIDYEIIKNLPIKYHLLLLDIYNEIYLTNSYPNSWKDTFIHFIDKPDGKSVRPIALTSCLCKLFESLIKNRLQWWCEFYEILPKTQSGFRTGKSCIDNLTNLTVQTTQALAEIQHLLAAFLDVSGAFDNVNSEILLNKLSGIGCSYNIISFIK